VNGSTPGGSCSKERLKGASAKEWCGGTAEKNNTKICRRMETGPKLLRQWRRSRSSVGGSGEERVYNKRGKQQRAGRNKRGLEGG
jgi:hypothetical protein